MASGKRPAGAGKTGPGNNGEVNLRDDDLERRRRELGAKLATRRPDRLEGEDESQTRSVSGYAQAFKLSSEFIAAIAVGIGIGWVLDRWAGTSPWGLIVFLLLGFCAGILNVLRAAGLVAEFGRGGKRSDEQD